MARRRANNGRLVVDGVFRLGEQISKGELQMRTSSYIMLRSSGGSLVKGKFGLVSGESAIGEQGLVADEAVSEMTRVSGFEMST